MGVAILSTEITVPTPAAGNLTIFPKADKELYIKDDTGLESQLSNVASTSTTKAPKGKNITYVDPDGVALPGVGQAYNSVKTAVESRSAGDIVLVYPGVYAEAPMTIPAGVDVIGMGSSGTVIIAATNINTSCVLLQDSSTIANTTVTGVTNNIGVTIATTTGAAIIRWCTFANCNMGAKVTSGSANFINCSLFGTIDKGISAIGSSSVGITGLAANAQAINTLVHATGIGTKITSAGLLVQGMPAITVYDLTDVSYNLGPSTFINIGIGLHTKGAANGNAKSFIIDTVATGVKLEDTSIVFLDQTSIRNETTSIHVVDNNTRIHFNDVQLNSDTAIYPMNYANASGTIFDTKVGNENLKVLSELSVGRAGFGSQTNLGEGDAYTTGMLVYTFDGAVYVNDTSKAQQPGDGNRVSFPNNSVGTIIYISSMLEDAQNNKQLFLGLEMLIDTVQTGGTIAIEYFNGATWQPINYQKSDKEHKGKDLFTEVGDFQYNFDYRILRDWVKNDEPSSGTLTYWIRLRISAGLTVSPQIDQIKIHSSRFEINPLGDIKYFARGRPIGTLPITYGSFNAAANSPSSEDMYLSTNLFVGRQENRFNDNTTDSTGFSFYAPLDIDTSCPLLLVFSYSPSDTVVANIDWEIRLGHVNVGSVMFSSQGAAPPTHATEQLVSLSQPTNGINGGLQIGIVELDISNILTEQSGLTNFGDSIIITLTRQGTTDAYAGHCHVLDLIVYYTKWREGGYVNSFL